MELKSDLVFKGALWNKLDREYIKLGKFFDTQWRLFKICLSIGILYDKQLNDEKGDVEEDGLHIPRTMFNRNSAEMQFFFQAAILTSECVEFEEKDRLYLAFSEDISLEELSEEDAESLKEGISKNALEFNKIEFLRKFANYGATKLEKCLSEHEIETMENLMEFLNASYKGETEELMAMKAIIDDDLEIECLDEN